MTALQKETVVRLRSQGKSYGDISSELGISVNTISSFCRRIDIGNSGKDIRLVATCKQCGKKIKSLTGHKQRQFCSDACRLLWWNSHQELIKRKAIYFYTCAFCGKSFSAYGNSKRKYCSHVCYIFDRYGKEVSAHE